MLKTTEELVEKEEKRCNTTVRTTEDSLKTGRRKLTNLLLTVSDGIT
jgi:hypothetical protein